MNGPLRLRAQLSCSALPLWQTRSFAATARKPWIAPKRVLLAPAATGAVFVPPRIDPNLPTIAVSLPPPIVQHAIQARRVPSLSYELPPSTLEPAPGAQVPPPLYVPPQLQPAFEDGRWRAAKILGRQRATLRKTALLQGKYVSVCGADAD